jgi:GntR family transcriptional regulator
MYLQIDPASSVPIFTQITNQIKYSIAMGAYGADDKLPSVRELAVQLRVNPNTVVKAYRELEREAVVYTQRGLGVFVSKNAPGISRKERKRIIDERLGAAVEEALHSDLTPDEVRKIVENKLNEKGTARRSR